MTFVKFDICHVLAWLPVFREQTRNAEGRRSQGKNNTTSNKLEEQELMIPTIRAASAAVRTGALSAALLLTTGALAQTDPESIPVEDTESEPAQPEVATAQAPAIDEIVVTAQRREQNLQDVPIAVTAASAEMLADARVENITDIQAVSPSINFDVTNSAANSANIRIRGIGTTGNNRSFEGAVGVFVDGVYRTRPGQALQNWVDISGLQILRGPQGTLFGKNTSAGAV